MENFISNNLSEDIIPAQAQNVAPFWLPLVDRKLFCAFETVFDAQKNKYIKYPHATNGKKGIKKIEKDLLDTCANVDEILQGKGSNWKLGFGFLEPIKVEGKYLVCVDVDIDADASDDAIARTEQIKKALLKTGAYYEESVSGRGCHFFLLCDENQIPLTYSSNEGWKIEVFSGFKNQSKLLCLTGNNAQGKLAEVNLSLLFSQQGIGPIKEPVASKSTTINIDASQYYNRVDVASLNKLKADIHEVKKAISFIPSDDYNDWLKVGMALSNEYGADGFKHWDYWSSSSDKYQSEEMNSKWSSFNGSGIGIGTLFMLAQSYGYKPSHQKNDAIDVFGPYLIEGTDSETGEVAESKQYTPEIVVPSRIIKAQEFILNRLISGGVVVLAAAPGGGKTTALVALAMRAAGLIKDGLQHELVRKVVIFTEHSTQVEEIITAMVASNACPASYEEVRECLIIINAKRLNFASVKTCAEFIDSNDYTTMNYKGNKSYLAQPLVVFDTTNANFDLENENDSQVVGRFMAEIKNQFYVNRGIHTLLSGHTSKALKHGDADSLSARGSGAYEGDAYQVIYITVSGNDRYLEIGGPKHRFHAVADSIKLISASAPITALDVFGDEISYPVTYIQGLEHLTKEEKDNAKAKAKEEKAAASKSSKENSIRADILDLMQRWPSALQAKSDAVIPTKRAIQDRCSGDTTHISEVFDQLVAEGHLVGFDMTNEIKEAITAVGCKKPHNNQKTYYWQRIRDDKFA